MILNTYAVVIFNSDENYVLLKSKNKDLINWKMAPSTSANQPKLPLWVMFLTGGFAGCIGEVVFLENFLT